MTGVRHGSGAELWREPGLGLGVDGEHDDEDASPAAGLIAAKLITARAIARALDSPCARCRRAEREGTPRRDCNVVGCDRWSTRRARRWMRRSQCLQRPGDPPCPARTGGRCACQVGFQLSTGGQWATTLQRLRDRAPDLSDVMLIDRDDDDD